MTRTIPLTALPRRLAAEGYVAPSYNTLRLKIINGAIPAEQSANGRWAVAERDLPRIVDALGCERVQSTDAAA